MGRLVVRESEGMWWQLCAMMGGENEYYIKNKVVLSIWAVYFRAVNIYLAGWR